MWSMLSSGIQQGWNSWDGWGSLFGKLMYFVCWLCHCTAGMCQNTGDPHLALAVQLCWNCQWDLTHLVHLLLFDSAQISSLVVAFTVGAEHFPSKIHNALNFSSFHPLATFFHCRHLQMTLLIFQVVDAFVVIFSRQTKISCYWLRSPWQGAAQGGAGASDAHFCWVSFLSSLVFLPLKKFFSPSAFLSQGWPSNKKNYYYFFNRSAAHPNEHWLSWRFLGRPCIYS